MPLPCQTNLWRIRTGGPGEPPYIRRTSAASWPQPCTPYTQNEIIFLHLDVRSQRRVGPEDAPFDHLTISIWTKR